MAVFTQAPAWSAALGDENLDYRPLGGAVRFQPPGLRSREHALHIPGGRVRGFNRAAPRTLLGFHAEIRTVAKMKYQGLSW